MTTTTTKSYRCRITRTRDNQLLVQTPGGKECRICLDRVASSNLLSDEQRDFIDYLTEGLGCGRMIDQDVTLAEMYRLAGIRDVIHPEAQTAPKTCCDHRTPDQKLADTVANIPTLPAVIAEEPKPEPKRTPRTFTDRDGSVTTDLTNDELLQMFRDNAPADHWLWTRLARMAEEHRAIPKAKDMIAFLADSFLLAVGMGLKKPMIRVVFKARRYKVYLSAKGTICFKTGRVVPGTSDPDGNEEYMGCLFQGRFLVAKDRFNRTERKLSADEQEFLDRLNADPVGFLAECGKDMDRCCYCNLPLEDPRSKKVGYGPICAGRWGLPWGDKEGEKVPSFAQLWSQANPEDRQSIRGLCLSLRQNPQDTFLWGLLGDILEANGWTKRPERPDRAVRVPAA